MYQLEYIFRITTQDKKTILNYITEHIRNIIKEAAHVSFLLNRITTHENKIVEQVRQIQCEQQRTRLTQARIMAYNDGWAAAKLLEFPECTRIVSIGEVAQVKTCEPQIVKFETTITKCGPQQIFNNFTIDINGYELTKFSSCYWRGNLINFNGQAYLFKNGNRTKIIPKIRITTRNLLDKFNLDNDNSIQFFDEEATETNLIMSQMSGLAEITAIINEHNSTPDNKPHASTALITAHERDNYNLLQKIVEASKYFGIFALSGTGVFILLRLCGGQTIIKTILAAIGLPNWITNALSCQLIDLCFKRRNDTPTIANIQLNNPSAVTIIQIPQQNAPTTSPREVTINAVETQRKTNKRATPTFTQPWRKDA